MAFCIKNYIKNLLCLRFLPLDFYEFVKWHDNRPNYSNNEKINFYEYVRSNYNKKVLAEKPIGYFYNFANHFINNEMPLIGISNHGDRNSTETILRNLKIDTIDFRNHKSVTIENCWIRNLLLYEIKETILIKDCSIGIIDIDLIRYKKLIFENSTILLPQCSSSEKPLNGDIVLKKIFIPKDEKTFPLAIQDIRNVKERLIKSGNHAAAGFFHSVELAHERKMESPINQLFSYLYEALSDYGNSTLRPLFFFFSSILLSMTYSLSFGSFELNNSDLAGWQKNLASNDIFLKICEHVIYTKDILSSFYFAWVSIFNPLGIFSSKINLLVPTTPTQAIVHIMISLFGTTSLALFFIALRRKFRMKQ